MRAHFDGITRSHSAPNEKKPSREQVATWLLGLKLGGRLPAGSPTDGAGRLGSRLRRGADRRDGRRLLVDRGPDRCGRTLGDLIVRVEQLRGVPIGVGLVGRLVGGRGIDAIVFAIRSWWRVGNRRGDVVGACLHLGAGATGWAARRNGGVESRLRHSSSARIARTAARASAAGRSVTACGASGSHNDRSIATLRRATAR